MFDVIVTNTDALKIAFIRRIFKSKEEAYSELSRIKGLVQQSGLGKRSVIINNETEYRTNNLDLSVGVEITGGLPDGTGLAAASAQPSECAKLVCKASEIEDAYQAVIERINLLGYQITGPFTELYYDDGTAELRVPVCGMVKSGDEAIVFPPFENDPEVPGRWKLLDIVPSREQFLYGSPKASHLDGIVFSELYFLGGGEKYWIVEGWTKGVLYTSEEFPARHTVANRYETQDINGHRTLFLEMNHIGADGMKSEKPEFWVYEKISSGFFRAADIQIRDNTDYPFIPDDSALGKWNVRDFYPRDIGGFDPGRQNRDRESLYVRSVEFAAGGKCVYRTRKNVFEAAWTRGLALNRHTETASAYRIVTVDNTEYMLLEWKSGDYSFAGQINWYVFTRA